MFKDTEWECLCVWLLSVKPPTAGNIQFERTKHSPSLSLLLSHVYMIFTACTEHLFQLFFCFCDRTSSPPSTPLPPCTSDYYSEPKWWTIWAMAWWIFHIKQELYPCFSLLFILKAGWHLHYYHRPSQQKAGAMSGWRYPKQGFLAVYANHFKVVLLCWGREKWEQQQ